jgi:hypothetical protein
MVQASRLATQTQISRYQPGKCSPMLTLFIALGPCVVTLQVFMPSRIQQQVRLSITTEKDLVHTQLARRTHPPPQCTQCDECHTGLNCADTVPRCVGEWLEFRRHSRDDGTSISFHFCPVSGPNIVGCALPAAPHDDPVCVCAEGWDPNANPPCSACLNSWCEAQSYCAYHVVDC